MAVYIHCTDGKYYEGLVYQDFAMRREWFICFDEKNKEPAELVIREAAFKNGLRPAEILKHRGFGPCLRGIALGRKDPHLRFFGVEDGKPVHGHPAISWFLLFKKGVPLPAPCLTDSIVESYNFIPDVQGGVFFGLKP